MLEKMNDRLEMAVCKAQTKTSLAFERLKDDSGQGTTEYAILVGVLVVIAILAVVLFRDKLQELWTSIADGINSL